MSAPTRHRRDGQAGFTLIELLVVILIIGILAAIAIPAFVGQRDKASDATAKSAVRNLSSEIEACWVSATGFADCQAFLNAGGTDLPVGTGAGQVQVVAATRTTYELRATSKADTAGVLHTFSILRDLTGNGFRTCAPAGEGGCRADSSW